MCETGLVLNCWRTLLNNSFSFRMEMAQPRLSMAARGLDSQIGTGGGKIEGSHILIIALSEHHVDYMNRKGWSLHYYAGGRGAFSPMCTSDSMDSCKFAPGCIFIKHRLYDQNTPQVQIYTPDVYLHRGVYCAYERGFRVFDPRPIQAVASSSIIGVTVLCPWARHINPCLELVQPRTTRPDITENKKRYGIKCHINELGFSR